MIYKKEIGVRTAARVYSDVVVPGLRNGEFFGNGLESIGGRPGFSYYFFYDGVRFRCCCKEYFDFFRNICVASACVERESVNHIIGRKFDCRKKNPVIAGFAVALKYEVGVSHIRLGESPSVTVAVSVEECYQQGFFLGGNHVYR